MSVTETSVPCSTEKVSRQSANFHPSIWGDLFISYPSDSKEINDQKEHQKLKEEVHRMLMMAKGNKPLEKLELIEAVQRLGVFYHFGDEISDMLRDVHNSNLDGKSNANDDDGDLYAISLEFRLLRQQGYKISCDVFKKFKDDQGNFKDSLSSDARGMLSFYEATHLRLHGEDILNEALSFTTTHLQPMAAQLNSPLGERICHALKQPVHKGLPRLEARRYFSFYEQEASRNEVLLAFAKLDFKILQKQHRKELSEIVKWWKELDFSRKLPFARDRVVECYFWILGLYFEPEYLQARRIVTKVIAITSVMDDIYDSFGTPEELEVFTAAIEGWEINNINQLPDYMKVYYKSLIELYTEIEENMVAQGKSYSVNYAKEAMKNQARAYFHESKWLHQQYIPTMEEYMPIGLATSGYYLLATTSFLGMGDFATNDSFKWVFNCPKIVRASAMIARLMDDIESHKFEQERGHVASSVECYMKQYDVTEEEAVHAIQKQVEDAWKDINEECLFPLAVPMPLLTRILNLARVMDVLYKDGDGYTHSGKNTKDIISSLLIDPVPM